MLTRQDLRLRKVPTGYKVAQRVGSGWELLSNVYETRRDAVAFINSVLTGTGFDAAEERERYGLPHP
jgi:hypothetical protein